MAEAIQLEGFDHGEMPIPAASRRGPFVASGGIYGRDRSTGEIPDSVAEQTTLVFDNIRAVVEAAGGTTDDIVKIEFGISDRSTTALVNEAWIRMFPDEAHRPARHTDVRELHAGLHVHAQFLAYVG